MLKNDVFQDLLTCALQAPHEVPEWYVAPPLKNDLEPPEKPEIVSGHHKLIHDRDAVWETGDMEKLGELNAQIRRGQSTVEAHPDAIAYFRASNDYLERGRQAEAAHRYFNWRSYFAVQTYNALVAAAGGAGE